MRNSWYLLMAAFLLSTLSLQAQNNWNQISTDNIVWKDSITKKKYTLIFINKDSGFDMNLKDRMVKTFFKVYPAQAKEYNKETARKVTFVIDPAYTGVAATGGTVVRYNPKWFRDHPGDIDVVTHEVMHIVQSYPRRAGPGWMTEGIADYVRFKFGVDNEGANWKLPDYSTKQNFDNAYRVTARFFVWLEKKVHPGIVKKMNTALHTQQYKPELWKELTGKSVEELWSDYSKDPTI